VKLHTLTATQRIPRRLEEVFDFFRSPENLSALTPAWLGFRILTPRPIPMQQGTLIDYTIGWAGIRMHWRTLITAFAPPHEFVDEQLKGPYLMWHHRHTFRAEGEETVMTDTVTYALPFGFLGSLVHALIVGRQIRGIFAFREEAIAARFGTTAGEGGR
jgi:ligand-binding SRPBCC domain-containing protein